MLFGSALLPRCELIIYAYGGAEKLLLDAKAVNAGPPNDANERLGEPRQRFVGSARLDG